MHPGVVHAHPRKCKVETLYEGFPPTHFDAVLSTQVTKHEMSWDKYLRNE